MDQLVGGVILGVLATLVLVRWRRSHSPTAERVQGQRHGLSPGEQLYQQAAQVSGFYEQTAFPVDLLDHPGFVAGVGLLCGSNFSGRDLIAYMGGDNAIVACMALEALRRRQDDTSELVELAIRPVSTVAFWTRFFALRFLDERCKPPLVGPVLAKVDSSWDSRLPLQFLEDFLRSRAERESRSR